MARIERWGRGPIFLVWCLAGVLSLALLGVAFAMEDSGGELAAAVMTVGVLMLLAGSMAVTWRWITGGSGPQDEP